MAQFLRLFQHKFNFSCYSSRDLEEALLDNESLLLADSCARLLRFLTGNADIVINNFDEHLIAVGNTASNKDGIQPLLTAQKWKVLSAEDKVLTLKWLIDHVFEQQSEDLHDHLNGYFTADDMRGFCAGQDALNNLYWYIDDLSAI